jgi:hypothetical protein
LLWNYRPSYFKAKKHIQEHYGEGIRASKYTSAGVGIYMFAVLGCIIIPMEIFLMELFTKLENPMIRNI